MRSLHALPSRVLRSILTLFAGLFRFNCCAFQKKFSAKAQKIFFIPEGEGDKKGHKTKLAFSTRFPELYTARSVDTVEIYPEFFHTQLPKDGPTGHTFRGEWLFGYLVENRVVEPASGDGKPESGDGESESGNGEPKKEEKKKGTRVVTLEVIRHSTKYAAVKALLEHQKETSVMLSESRYYLYNFDKIEVLVE